MINKIHQINKLKELDITSIFRIILNNIFLILFFTLLGLITGYFIVNQENEIRKFEISIAIPENDYSSKNQLELINEHIIKITKLEREKLYIKFFQAQNPSMSIILPEVGQSINSIEVSSSDIMNILLEYTKDEELYYKTNKLFNEKLTKDFTDSEKINDLKLTSIPSSLSISENINGRPQITIRIFFADNYSDYVVDNYSKIYLENIIALLKETLVNKYSRIIDEYELQREMVYDFVMFGLDSYSDASDIEQNNFAYNKKMKTRKENIKELAKKFNYIPKDLNEIIDLYGDPVELLNTRPIINKKAIINVFQKTYPKFNSKEKYFSVIEDTGILDGGYDYFYRSSSLETSYKARYKSQLILQENNSILGFTIFGFVFGVILSFLRFYYFNIKK